MIIYKTTNLINNKIYIGQDTKNNPKYLGSGTLIKRAIKKYGKQNFIKETIIHTNDFKLLQYLEQFWIKTFDSTNRKIGYNLKSGGK